jgi:hypothetical protein
MGFLIVTKWADKEGTSAIFITIGHGASTNN